MYDHTETKIRRLLCVLYVWVSEMPSDTTRERLLHLDVCLVVLHIVLPLLNYFTKIIGKVRVKLDKLSACWVNESERFGMKGLSWQNLKAVVNKLTVLGERRAFVNLIPAVCCIIKERVTQVLHVCANLVRAARLQFTLDQ